MKIVVLDGHTLNPNDLSWKPFEQMGTLEVYPRTPPERLIERSVNAEVLLVNKVKLTADEINQLPNLKYIGICATGFDNIDLKRAAEKGITVTNIPAYGTESVAQHVFALLLELTNKVGLHNKSVHELEWVRNADFSYFKAPLVELASKTMGVMGYGAIGKKVCEIAAAFGMRVLVHSKHATNVSAGELVSLETLFQESDVVSIHAALTPQTSGVVNDGLLSVMKHSALLINTSRGAIINESDLAHYLNSGKIAGAALDVLSKEPPIPDNPILTAKNCIITPHISWVSRESRQRLMDIAVENLQMYLKQTPVNVVTA